MFSRNVARRFALRHRQKIVEALRYSGWLLLFGVLVLASTVFPKFLLWWDTVVPAGIGIAIVALVVDGLRLRSAHAVPPQFWRMPPHYWPRSMPPGAEAFYSSAFSAYNRGPDGEHYLLVHDKAQDRAFVWVKSNF